MLAQQRLEAAVEKAHGVLGCLAFAFFFPTGSILLRMLSGRKAVWLHAAWQVFGWLLALATLGMGVWMAKGTEYIETYHAILGIIVIVGISLQPLTGFVHHLVFKKRAAAAAAAGGAARSPKRTAWSYAHMGLGMPLITLGIINGGFGLELVEAETKYIVVYSIFAVLIWLTWMAVSLTAQRRRSRAQREVLTRQVEQSGSDDFYSSEREKQNREISA